MFTHRLYAARGEEAWPFTQQGHTNMVANSLRHESATSRAYEEG